MKVTANGWQLIDEQVPALAREYSFGPGMATTLVIGLGPGRLLAVSPACDMQEAAHGDLKAYGEVVALLAPNGMHHLGVASWLKRWPNASAYAAEPSLERLANKSSAGAVFKPLSALAPLPDGLLIDNPPGLKNSDLVLRVRTGQGWLWYFNDLVMNLRELPRQPFFRLIFLLSGAKTGLSVPKLPQLMLVRDKRVTGRWLLQEIDARPPAVVVFGHGDLLSGPRLGERLKAVIRERY
jgi:hypothetical protein